MSANLLAGAEDWETVLRCGEETIVFISLNPYCWRVWSGTPDCPFGNAEHVQPKAPVSAPAHRTAHHAVLPWAGHRPSVGRSGQERGVKPPAPGRTSHASWASAGRRCSELAALQSWASCGQREISSPCWIRPRWNKLLYHPYPHQMIRERKYRTNRKNCSLCFAHCPCLPHSGRMLRRKRQHHMQSAGWCGVHFSDLNGAGNYVPAGDGCSGGCQCDGPQGAYCHGHGGIHEPGRHGELTTTTITSASPRPPMRSPPLWPKGLRILLLWSRPIWLPSSITTPRAACRCWPINTLGVLYIVESGDTVHSVEDLRGNDHRTPAERAIRRSMPSTMC